jgi:glycosyltransferase involved in cell wall biosynthesis
MSKAKILFLTGSLKQGGAEYQLISLAKLFRDRGHTIKVIALTDHQFYKKFTDEFNIDYAYFSNDLSRVKRTFLTINEVNAFKPDVIISYLRSVSLVAMLSKLFSRQRTILITSERTSLTIPYYDNIYFFLSRYVDAMTVNSLFKFRYIRENYPLLAHKVFFVANILDLSRFPQESVSKNSPSLKLAYIGRIAPEKNLDKLISALGVISREGTIASLDLYGDVKHKEHHSKLLAQIHTLQLTHNVKFHGPTNDVLSIYKKADAICLLSSYEGFSNVLSEALACGCPIIASDIEENRFLVDDQINGFLVNVTTTDIAEAIRKFAKLTNEQRNDIANNNLNKAQNTFNQEALYEQYTAIIAGIQGKKKL